MCPKGTTVQRTCEYCGTVFYPLLAQVKRGRGRLCSIACRIGAYRAERASTYGQRFWAKVDTTGDCWKWTGSPHSHGYGVFGGKLAHRVAWQLTNGPISNGLEVCHTCDNPMCCRPDHLFLGTQAENMKDMHAKGRQAMGDAVGIRKYPERYPRGERHHATHLTVDDVRDIRRRATAGETRALLAEEYGVGILSIGKIVRRERWQHID